MSNGYVALLEQYGLSHTEFDEIIGQTEPGNCGRVLVPWYGGERTPDLPDATPVYFGFGPGDFNARVLCRAVLEGHVLNLWNGFSRMPVEPVEIRLTGGLAGSPSWCQMIADVFGADAVPVRGEGAALGAAVHAAWVWSKESGASSSMEEIAEPFVVVEEEKRRRPDPAHAEVYGIVRRLFRAVSERARGLECEDPFALRAELLSLRQQED
jgi:xylulokinase